MQQMGFKMTEQNKFLFDFSIFCNLISKFSFSILCGKYFIDENIALENENIRKQIAIKENLKIKSVNFLHWFA